MYVKVSNNGEVPKNIGLKWFKRKVLFNEGNSMFFSLRTPFAFPFRSAAGLERQFTA